MEGLDKSAGRLVVIPSDPIAAYERAGYDWLERYFNPLGMFGEVYALSPQEQGERQAHGMTILGVPERAFRRTLRDIRPQVVRAYGGYWPADLACYSRLPGVPVVVSVHSTNPSLLHRSVRYADRVICLSKAVEKQVLAIGANPTRIRILPNRVETRVFHPRTDQAALQSVSRRFPEGRHILHVGRKTEQKNLDTLIRALALLPPDYLVVFIGRGDCAPYVALAKAVNVAERCFWVDSVPNSELPYWYSWCDCMCLPSRWEGFGIVLIEAAACGAAIVTSDIAPMNEYLTHDVSACLVKDYEDPQALAEAIRRVCEDAEYHRTITAGAIKAAQPFDRRLVDTAEVAIYREVMALDLPALSFAEKVGLSLGKAGFSAAVLSRRVTCGVRRRLGRVGRGAEWFSHSG